MKLRYHRRAAIHICMNTSIPWEWYRTFLAVLRGRLFIEAHRGTLNIHSADGGAPYCRAGKRLSPGPYLPARQTGRAGVRRGAGAAGAHAEAMDNTARALERTAASLQSRQSRAAWRGAGGRQRRVVGASAAAAGCQAQAGVPRISSSN